MSSQPDAIVVGARPGGCAAAIALARAGRRVIALDRARFPSDTLSTHLLFPGGVAELEALGALRRVDALGAPPMPAALVGAAGMTATGGYTPVDGIAHALCVRRPGLDAALVATARAAGAEVRERVRVTDLVWRGGRVAGVVAGAEELRAPLVVGADGRGSTVARRVGASEPYRRWDNERACAFAYWRDGRPEWRPIAAQWREGRELGTAFPCDGGLVLVLLMPPVERIAAFRADPAGEYARTIDAIPPLRERLRGCSIESKVRIGAKLPSYFRRSAGPGWALAGDAGHFKDPVTAQGIRDALRFGRRLGELAAPALDDPAALDRALAAWERERDRECLETYQWTTLLARAETLNPLEAELYRSISRTSGLGGPLLDVFARTRRPSRALPPRRAALFALRALARGREPRREVLRVAAREARLDARFRFERMQVCFSGYAGDMSDKTEHEAAEKAKQEYEDAQKTMEEWEQKDELPADLNEWPSDKAKYVTFGGGEGDHGYDEGPETKLGPSEVRHEPGGKVTVAGKEVDDPDKYKGEPIPGGPTDPEAPELAGEKRKREKRERMSEGD